MLENANDLFLIEPIISVPFVELEFKIHQNRKQTYDHMNIQLSNMYGQCLNINLNIHENACSSLLLHRTRRVALDHLSAGIYQRSAALSSIDS